MQNYVYDDSACKQGWFHDAKWINIAMGVLKDQSHCHKGAENGI